MPEMIFKRMEEFPASYFDLHFALNEKTHPGEKRLIEDINRIIECLKRIL